MAAIAQKFGSSHTETKLQKVEAYLNRYATVMKNQSFDLVYIDAFAGSGASERKLASGEQQVLDILDAREIVEGSAARALRISPPFGRYVFIDQKRSNVRSLELLRAQHPALADRIRVVPGEANDLLKKFCEKTNWRRTRAVVFLDPFGLSVEWSTIVALAKTKAVDLWYLIPVGIGMSRQVKLDGTVLADGGKRIDAMLGTPSWRDVVITRQTRTDLFGNEIIDVSKCGAADELSTFVMRRLASVFAGGVSDRALPLGYQGRHWYSLAFACANPSPSANELARRLANAILRK